MKARTRDPVLPASITTACSWLGKVSYCCSNFCGIAFTIFIDSFLSYLYLELLQRNSRSHPPKLLAAQASRNGLEQDIEPQQKCQHFKPVFDMVLKVSLSLGTIVAIEFGMVMGATASSSPQRSSTGSWRLDKLVIHRESNLRICDFSSKYEFSFVIQQ